MKAKNRGNIDGGIMVQDVKHKRTTGPSSCGTKFRQRPAEDGERDSPHPLHPSNKLLCRAHPAEGIAMAAARPLHLLICSVGNPGPSYANTLHSAAHTVLSSLAHHLGASSFQRDAALGKGLVSHAGDWTLWQSTSFMNESGKGVRAAWLNWSRDRPADDARLVVVHDELEKPLGSVTLRTAQGASARGHNGLKSIKATIGSTPYARLGIGIGRPLSREPDDVANYVLRKMTPAEKAAIERSVADVVAKLKLLE